MTKRLQVLLDDTELHEIQRLAKGRRITTAAWVRESLRSTVEAQTRGDLEAKLAAIRRAIGHGFPAGDIDRMLGDIEHGYRVLDEG